MPVGDDQRQHLELAKDLADTFNRTYKTRLFPLPRMEASTSHPFSLPLPGRALTEISTASTHRVLSLKNPTSKMSKSAPDAASRILLTDSAKDISRKIKASVTDSLGNITYDPVARPGTSNLLAILAACTDEDVRVVAARYEGKGHGPFKVDVAEAVERLIEGPRKEFERIRGEREYLDEVAREGARKAKDRSEVTLKQVRVTIGLP